MGRAKLPIKFIESEKSRNTTFLKRKKGLKKKMYEFSTLCDVDACMVIVGKSSTAANSAGKLETWPEDMSEVYRILDRFNKASKDNKEKHMSNITDFLASRINHLQKDLQRDLPEKSKPCTAGMWPISNMKMKSMSTNDLLNLMDVVESKIRHVKERLQELTEKKLANDYSQQAFGFSTSTMFDVPQPLPLPLPLPVPVPTPMFSSYGTSWTCSQRGLNGSYGNLLNDVKDSVMMVNYNCYGYNNNFVYDHGHASSSYRGLPSLTNYQELPVPLQGMSSVHQQNISTVEDKMHGFYKSCV